ncbi:MAG: hypothetical protein GY926_08695 [bacterium]|nr:hypothetical protein [bacterium]
MGVLLIGEYPDREQQRISHSRRSTEPNSGIVVRNNRYSHGDTGDELGEDLSAARLEPGVIWHTQYGS